MTAASDVTAPTPESALAAQLRARGQRVTSQRLVIHRALSATDRHVTAEQVRDAVRDRLPGVSLPTVYATLDLFEELGMVRRVSGPRGAALYDPRLDPHHHLVCVECGRVEDIDARLDLRPATHAADARGFTPGRCEVIVSGRCSGCGPP